MMMMNRRKTQRAETSVGENMSVMVRISLFGHLSFVVDIPMRLDRVKLRRSELDERTTRPSRLESIAA